VKHGKTIPGLGRALLNSFAVFFFYCPDIIFQVLIGLVSFRVPPVSNGQKALLALFWPGDALALAYFEV